MSGPPVIVNAGETPPSSTPRYTFETWLHAIKTQNTAIAVFAIIPPPRGVEESPEDIALHTDLVDDKGRPSVRAWSKLLLPSKVTWQSKADEERAQEVYEAHHKMVQRMRNRNNTNGQRERGKERLKRKYAEMTPEAKKQRFREGDKKKAAMKDKRRSEGVKKCSQGDCGCGEILPLEEFVYAMKDVEGVEEYHGRQGLAFNKSREHAVCRRCRKRSLERTRGYEAKRGDRSQYYTDYERRPEVRAMRKAWREENRDLCRLYCAKYLESHREQRNEANKLRLRAYRETDAYQAYKQRYNSHLISMLSSYRNREKWNLSDEDGMAILLSPECFYCGAAQSYPDLEGNGRMCLTLDRIEPEGAYDLSNVVPCCKQCNTAKHISDLHVFFQMCHNVSLYQTQGIPASVALPCFQSYDQKSRGQSCSPSDLQTYIYAARKRNLSFELTEHDFNGTVSMSCHYCGAPPVSGVDRLDSSLGYTRGNTVPCCSLCNKAKSTYSEEEFIQMCTRVASRHAIMEE